MNDSLNEKNFMDDEEKLILKKIVELCDEYGSIDDLFKPIDEIIILIENEIQEINSNCKKALETIKQVNHGSLKNIINNFNNFSYNTDKISHLERKLFLYDRLLCKIEILVENLEDKKLPRKKLNKIFMSMINSFSNTKKESTIIVKPIDLDKELEEILDN